MPFPDSKRVVYEKNQLHQVICQLKFPPILRIDSTIPADFQEAIRDEFPLFAHQTVKTETMPPDELLRALPETIRESMFHTGKRVYNFKSLDEQWGIGLTRDFLALSAQNYTRWEDFRRRLEGPLAALLRFYRPSVFTRIGLRYQNVLIRSRLGLGDISWSELLAPQIAAELNSPVADFTLEAQHTLVIRLNNEQGVVRIRHGLINAQLAERQQEVCYLIDNDFFVEQKMNTELDDVWTILDNFKIRARRLFRWCISDRLHEAMEPTEI